MGWVKSDWLCTVQYPSSTVYVKGDWTVDIILHKGGKGEPQGEARGKRRVGQSALYVKGDYGGGGGTSVGAEHWARGALGKKSTGQEEHWARRALGKRSTGQEEHWARRARGKKITGQE